MQVNIRKCLSVAACGAFGLMLCIAAAAQSYTISALTSD